MSYHEDKNNAAGAAVEISDDELFDLFAPRRADEDSFEEGVEARIRALENEANASAASDETAQLPSRLRRAAAAAALDPSVLAAGGAVGAKKAGVAGAKWLPGALAFPALLLGSLVGAFALSSKALYETVHDDSAGEPRGGESAEERKQRRSRLRKTNLQLKAVMAALITPAILLMASRPGLGSDLFIAYMALTMISLVYLARQLATRGVLVRDRIRRTVDTAFNGAFAVVFAGALNLGAAAPSSDLGFGPSAGVMLIGMGLIRWKTTSHWSKAAFAVAAIGLINVLGFTHSSPASLRRQVERIDLDPASYEGWEAAAAVARALDGLGEDPPVLDRSREALEAALETPEQIDRSVWSSAGDLHLLDGDSWRKAAELDRFRLPRSPDTDDLNRYEDRFIVRAHVAARTLAPEELEALTEAADGLWPTVGRRDGLAQALHAVEALDALGRRDLVDSRRDLVHELLQRHWVSPSRARFPFGRSGGFTWSPDLSSTGSSRDTLIAVELMNRFGVPKSVDLRRVQAFLRGEARAFPLFFELDLVQTMKPRAALLTLREGVGLPRRSLLQTVMAERFFLATILLVLLGLLAIRWAPASRNESIGAQP